MLWHISSDLPCWAAGASGMSSVHHSLVASELVHDEQENLLSILRRTFTTPNSVSTWLSTSPRTTSWWRSRDLKLKLPTTSIFSQASNSDRMSLCQVTLTARTFSSLKSAKPVTRVMENFPRIRSSFLWMKAGQMLDYLPSEQQSVPPSQLIKLLCNLWSLPWPANEFSRKLSGGGVVDTAYPTSMWSTWRRPQRKEQGWTRHSRRKRKRRRCRIALLKQSRLSIVIITVMGSHGKQSDGYKRHRAPWLWCFLWLCIQNSKLQH